MKTIYKSKKLWALGLVVGAFAVAASCQKSALNQNSGIGSEGDNAQKVYVAPGKHDAYYAFLSGGFNGQVDVYGMPSSRLLKVIPAFSQNPENGYGYTEESKPMLNTSFGQIPWDDLHHPKLSRTDGKPDGRWLFVNGNNTPGSRG